MSLRGLRTAGVCAVVAIAAPSVGYAQAIPAGRAKSVASKPVASKPVAAKPVAVKPAAVKPVAAAPDFAALAARALRTFDVPGLALAVVKDGKVVVAKGFGVRTLGDPTPVDDRTLFAIASNTKVLTAAALGILVDEKKLEWDAPVGRYLPWFQLWDPWVTREITVRDLLVHRSGLGLGGGDLLWWPKSTYSRREVIERLRYLQPTTSFRSAYAYDNVLYLTAGELIAAVSGQPYEEFVQARLLTPMGMTSSAPRLSALASATNVATPHAPVDGTVKAVARFDSDVTNPAGGIVTNAADIAKWLNVFLADGALPGGGRVFSEDVAHELSSPVTPLRNGPMPPGLESAKSQFLAYALGLVVNDYHGHLMLSHTGGLPGYVSRVTWMPDQKLGIAVLTNQESGAAFTSLTVAILDAYLGLHEIDWFAALQKQRAAQGARDTEQGAAREAAREARSSPSLPLEGYAGTYRDAWYGDVAVAHEGGRLVMRFGHTPSLVGDLEHWQHDTFVARWRDRELRADAFVTFALTPEGTVERATMKAVSAATDFSFDFQDLRLERRP